ncbi:MAG: hypothetical protein KAV82_11105 [Phycisphaerae bacterium]|nr:hypothetical protein [Phycisphaerae bacterium]
MENADLATFSVIRFPVLHIIISIFHAPLLRAPLRVAAKRYGLSLLTHIFHERRDAESAEKKGVHPTTMSHIPPFSIFHFPFSIFSILRVLRGELDAIALL